MGRLRVRIKGRSNFYFCFDKIIIIYLYYNVKYKLFDF